MRLLPGLLTVGVSAQNGFSGIPQYGPTSGDRCLSDQDDQTGKYTMQYSIEPYNAIFEQCNNTPDCDIIVRFSKPRVFGSHGVMDFTYHEMGSTQSSPCYYKSPKVTAMEVVYTKKGSQFRTDQVPTYGPVGMNNCIGPGDRPYENYSMLKNYESLSLAEKYCNMYPGCDIIVEIDRTQVRGRSLTKLYEIGNTRARYTCEPRPQNGVRVSRVPFDRSQYHDLPVPVHSPGDSRQGNQNFINNENEYNNGYNNGYNKRPKRSNTTDFKCLDIGEVSENGSERVGCMQVFDNISTANLACSLFENCALIGKNANGNFELFSESNDDTAFDLQDYDLSIPTMDKTQTSLIYDFTTILNHENMAITQITAYDPVLHTSFVEVPQHGHIPESTHLNFYDQNLSIVIQDNTCVIRHPEIAEKITNHVATTIDYKVQKQHGELTVEDGEYAISDLSNIRDDLPLIAKKQCYGKALIGLDFDLKNFGHDTDFGAKFFFMNETDSVKPENSLLRTKRSQEPEKFDPVTGKRGRIVNCDGKKACGDENFTAAVCSKESCGTLFCLFLRRPNMEDPKKPAAQGSKATVIETPIVSWNHIIKAGYWCMPCCILDDQKHAKMKLCSEMPTQEDICKQQDIQGRCGIEFDP